MCRDARQGYHDLPAYRTCLGIRGWSDGNEAETCICGTVRAYAGGVSITSRFPNFVEISLGAECWQRKERSSVGATRVYLDPSCIITRVRRIGELDTNPDSLAIGVSCSLEAPR